MELFDLYLQHRSLIEVCKVANARGWTTKTTVYKNGTHKSGVAWNKARLYDILVNVTYIGQVAHKGKLYAGEQEGIVDQSTFAEAQMLLKANSQNGGGDTRNKHGALLRGLLKCGHCGAAMTHIWTKKPPNRLYRYYTCSRRVRQGKDACPTPSLPAQEIEDFVVEQIKTLARDPELQRQVFEEAGRQQKAFIPKLESERRRLLKDRQAKSEEIRRLVAAIGVGRQSAAVTQRLAELEAVVGRIDGRAGEIDAELDSLRQRGIDSADVGRKLAEFDGIWEVLMPAEQTQMVQSLVETVTCGLERMITLRFCGYSNESYRLLNSPVALC